MEIGQTTIASPEGTSPSAFNVQNSFSPGSPEGLDIDTKPILNKYGEVTVKKIARKQTWFRVLTHVKQYNQDKPQSEKIRVSRLAILKILVHNTINQFNSSDPEKQGKLELQTSTSLLGSSCAIERRAVLRALNFLSEKGYIYKYKASDAYLNNFKIVVNERYLEFCEVSVKPKKGVDNSKIKPKNNRKMKKT